MPALRAFKRLPAGALIVQTQTAAQRLNVDGDMAKKSTKKRQSGRRRVADTRLKD
jgi:hypothetical protein